MFFKFFIIILNQLTKNEKSQTLPMAINLQKGQKIDLGLLKIRVGLGWEPNEGTGNDFDLDASAFMLNKSRRIPSEEHFIIRFA